MYISVHTYFKIQVEYINRKTVSVQHKDNSQSEHSQLINHHLGQKTASRIPGPL